MISSDSETPDAPKRASLSSRQTIFLIVYIVLWLLAFMTVIFWLDCSDACKFILVIILTILAPMRPGGFNFKRSKKGQADNDKPV